MALQLLEYLLPAAVLQRVNNDFPLNPGQPFELGAVAHTEARWLGQAYK